MSRFRFRSSTEGVRSGGIHAGVIIPMLCSALPVSAPSDNDWALGVDSQLAFEFPTLSETARPVNAVRIRARFPRGATFSIVCPWLPANVDGRASYNAKDGASAARGLYPHALPERSQLSHCEPVGYGWPERLEHSQCENWHLRRARSSNVHNAKDGTSAAHGEEGGSVNLSLHANAHFT